MIVLLLAIFSFFQFVSADQALSNYAERVLDSAVYQQPTPSIIGEREWKELQLDRLVTTLDRTTTSFGRWGLVKLLHPIADKKQLQKRKEIITFLVDNPEKMNLFKQQLERVHRFEQSLLTYWDAQDQLNRSVEQFYFSSIGLRELNKSSIALNVSTALEGFNAVKNLLSVLAMWGVSKEFLFWSAGIKPKFNFWEGVKSGLMDPIMRHYPWLYQLEQKSPEQESYTSKDWAQATSWGDVFNIWKSGVSDNNEKIFSGFGTIGGALMATASMLYYDYQWVNTVDFIARRIIFMNRSLNLLQQRVSDAAQCIAAIMDLHKLIAFQNAELSDYLNVDDESDELVENFVKKLVQQRFLQKPGLLYSRGHVLTMHQDIKRMKKFLIPLLHSVALLDAYCSIAQLYKESQDELVVFSFPEFVTSPTPFIHYHNAWLPLLSFDEAITNDLSLGGDTPGKIIITGPSGGGKSIILETYAVAAVLAQSWCIIPAQNARQTMFARIRTALALQKEKGLSDFMTEIKTMAGLLNDIRKSDIDHPMLVLIDEPYKTTVPDESAKRIYQFGKDIARYSHALVGIATHVKKPILLERDTGGIFGNYQVEIKEKSFGVFERLFKIEKGTAMWWFEDEDQRSRFIDWISTKTVVSN